MEENINAAGFLSYALRRYTRSISLPEGIKKFADCICFDDTLLLKKTIHLQSLPPLKRLQRYIAQVDDPLLVQFKRIRLAKIAQGE